MNSSLYVGPIANLFGGAEVAWLIGLVVSGVIFYWFSPARRASLATRTR